MRPTTTSAAATRVRSAIPLPGPRRRLSSEGGGAGMFGAYAAILARSGLSRRRPEDPGIAPATLTVAGSDNKVASDGLNPQVASSAQEYKHGKSSWHRPRNDELRGQRP